MLESYSTQGYMGNLGNYPPLINCSTDNFICDYNLPSLVNHYHNPINGNIIIITGLAVPPPGNVLVVEWGREGMNWWHSHNTLKFKKN